MHVISTPLLVQWFLSWQFLTSLEKSPILEALHISAKGHFYELHAPFNDIAWYFSNACRKFTLRIFHHFSISI